jgi:hypothetical protein
VKWIYICKKETSRTKCQRMCLENVYFKLDYMVLGLQVNTRSEGVPSCKMCTFLPRNKSKKCHVTQRTVQTVMIRNFKSQLTAVIKLFHVTQLLFKTLYYYFPSLLELLGGGEQRLKITEWHHSMSRDLIYHVDIFACVREYT